MDDEYNFYNLEAPFKLFLNSGNKKISPISINNYLSDLRHFFGWIVLTIKNRNAPVRFASDDYHQILSQFLTEEIVRSYADYLGANNIPMRTINRRLSTLRKFCSFCISQGWIKVNPAKQISNVSSRHPDPSSSRPYPSSSRKRGSGEQILNQVEDDSNVENDSLTEFRQSLEQNKISPAEAKQIMEDVREFFVISSNH